VSDETTRRVVTTVTLLAAIAAVAVMAIWGLNAATAPVKDDTSAVASDGPTCPPEEQEITLYLTRPEVTVSVWNTGKRKGRAGATLTMLEDAGFRAGEIGNADPKEKVRRAEVRTTEDDELEAQLVARSMGRGTKVVVTDQEYGPGVDVFIGDKFGGLNKEAPRRLKLPEPDVTCR
jgi:hypothetical protein